MRHRTCAFRANVGRATLKFGIGIGAMLCTAMVSVLMGTDRVVLIGFRTQHRAQTHGTFKLLFNTLLK